MGHFLFKHLLLSSIFCCFLFGERALANEQTSCEDIGIEVVYLKQKGRKPATIVGYKRDGVIKPLFTFGHIESQSSIKRAKPGEIVALRRQLGEVATLLATLVISTTESADAKLPFKHVSVSIRKKSILSCLSDACKILTGRSPGIYQSKDSNMLLVHVEPGKVISAAKMLELIQKGKHYPYQNPFSRKVGKISEEIKEAIEAISAKKAKMTEVLAEKVLPILKESSDRVLRKLDELDGGNLKASTKVELLMGVLSVELDANVESTANLRGKVIELSSKESDKIDRLVSMIRQKLGSKTFNDKVIAMAGEHHRSTVVSTLEELVNKQNNNRGTIINVADLVTVIVHLSEVEIDDFFFTSQTSRRVVREQNNNRGIIVNTLDDINIAVGIRRGANVALAIRESLLELGYL